MKRLAPSLTWRITLGFVAAHALAIVASLLILWPFARWDNEDHVGPGVAIAFLVADLRVAPDGALSLNPSGYLPTLTRINDGLWYIVHGRSQTLRHGPVPSEANALLGLIGTNLKTTDLGNFGASGFEGDASGETIDFDGQRVVVLSGGVRPETISFPIWLYYLWANEFYLAPLLIAPLTALGALIAIPLIMRSIRPTARAAAQLSSSDFKQRLPERHVVRELLPIVRAFNAALDRVEQAFQQRQRFIADVAHELRTPLAVLNMHVEELPDSSKKPDIQRSIYRLGHMVGQMLDSERLTLADRRRERIDVVVLAREIVADMAPLAVANGYDIAFDSRLPSSLTYGDPHAISRAISNVLGNAVAHGGNRGTIDVRIQADGALEISDEGPGIALEAAERVFEPFRRERWDRDGCGLGLHLVREIMRAHGGDAMVGARGGAGATLRLMFPPADGDTPPQPVQA